MTTFHARLSDKPLRLREPLSVSHRRSDTYVPASGLVEAMDVAMMLGVPLLLTGEPGTGKTMAADWLAKELGAGDLIPLVVKSGTTGRDLLYTFDEVARFRDANRGGAPRPMVDYLELSALGSGILRAAGGADTLCGLDGKPLEGERLARQRARLAECFPGEAFDGGKLTLASLMPRDGTLKPEGEHRVVLIDELDKAPRDTPNDLLFEIEKMEFTIAELGVKVSAPAGLRPVVIITSNSEKALPEPFMRRCVFFSIPEPDDAAIADIVASVLKDLPSGAMTRSALAYYRRLRESTRLQKKPGTAELIAWLDILRSRPDFDPDRSIQEACQAQPQGLATELKWPLLGALVKSEEDLAEAMSLLGQTV